MKDNYTYPAIIWNTQDGYTLIRFPDFGEAMTEAIEGEDFVAIAQDYLTIIIADYEDSDRELPKAGEADYELEEGQRLVYINVWMPYHRTRIKEVYVKKTLTIPVWLDMLAKENNINFSATLVKGLKEALKIEKNI